jgi:hypothetical protein
LKTVQKEGNLIKNKKRQELLDRIRKDAKKAGVEVNWEHLNAAPFAAIQFASIALQLHKK